MSPRRSTPRWGLLALIAWLVLPLGCAEQGTRQEPRFYAVDVFVDAGSEALAAWQVEVRDAAELALLVSVEGGEHEAFLEPAGYDPRALQHHRIVLVAYHLGSSCPTGRTRVATLHFAQERAGQPRFEVVLVAAAAPDGRVLDARVEIQS